MKVIGLERAFRLDSIQAHASPELGPALAPWPASVKRILCIRPDNMGDVLMSSPAMVALKRAVPERHITLLASKAGAAVARFIPEIDEVLTFDPPWARHDMSADSNGTRELIQTLADGQYDAAVIFTVYSQSPLPAAMICFLANIPRRLAHCRENPYSLLTDWLPDPEPASIIRHEVERQLQLVEAVISQAAGKPLPETGGAISFNDAVRQAAHPMRFILHADDRTSCATTLRLHGIKDCVKYVVIHAGSTAASRRYPPERFAQLAALLLSNTPYHVILTGTRDEQALAECIREEALACQAPQDAFMSSRITSLAGSMPLGAFGALLDGACLLISNNSGPVHIAAALGKPVVDIYALTNPQHTPWNTPHRVLFKDVDCRWCYKSLCPRQHHECLLGLDVETIYSAVRALLCLPPPLPSIPTPIKREDHIWSST